MSFSICVPYRPEPGEVQPIRTEIGTYIDSLVPGRNIFTFWSWNEEDGGKWILASKLKDGEIIELGDLQGRADEPPTCSRGFIETIIRMFKAGDKNKGPVFEAIRSKKSAHLKKLIQFQDENMARRRMFGKHGRTIHRDHPYFSPCG